MVGLARHLTDRSKPESIDVFAEAASRWDEVRAVGLRTKAQVLHALLHPLHDPYFSIDLFAQSVAPLTFEGLHEFQGHCQMALNKLRTLLICEDPRGSLHQLFVAEQRAVAVEASLGALSLQSGPLRDQVVWLGRQFHRSLQRLRGYAAIVRLMDNIDRGARPVVSVHLQNVTRSGLTPDTVADFILKHTHSGERRELIEQLVFAFAPEQRPDLPREIVKRLPESERRLKSLCPELAVVLFAHAGESATIESSEGTFTGRLAGIQDGEDQAWAGLWTAGEAPGMDLVALDQISRVSLANGKPLFERPSPQRR
jgi:hypothetical protein